VEHPAPPHRTPTQNRVAVLCLCQARVSIRPPVHASIRSTCYQTCEHDILKANEVILMQTGKSGLWSKGIKRSTLEARHMRPAGNIILGPLGMRFCGLVRA